MLGEDLHDRVYGPELMLRYNDRCARARPPRLALRRTRPGLARAARAQPAPAPPGHRDRRRLLAAVPAADRPRRRTRSSHQINEARPDVLWVGIGVPKQEKWMARMRERLDVPVMCAVGAAFDFHAGPHLAGALVDAAARARVDLPDRPGAAPAAARATSTTTRASCSAFARQYLASAGAARPALASDMPDASPSSASAGSACRSRCPSPTAACTSIGVEREPRVLDRCAAGRCRSTRPARRSCSSACSPAAG